MSAANLKVVAVPVRASQHAPILSPDAALPYWGVYIAIEHRWIRALNLVDVVSEYECFRDASGYGARDMGGESLQLMDASAGRKRKVGKIAYNGRVFTDVVVVA